MVWRAEVQHFFHPLNLWCRCGGRLTCLFRLYEVYVWETLMRRLFIRKRKSPDQSESY
jgi:hypothetical protein